MPRLGRYQSNDEANTVIIRTTSNYKHNQSMILSENCTSLCSSRLKLASVADELEFNKENASIDDDDSVKIPIDSI